MFVVARGFWLWLLDQLEVDGLTMPWRTIYMRAEYMDDPGLRAHELAHIRQIDRMGPVRFSVVYLYQLWRYGYQNMPLEIEARFFQGLGDHAS
jgi:hypothetical protein